MPFISESASWGLTEYKAPAVFKLSKNYLNTSLSDAIQTYFVPSISLLC